MRRYRGKTFGIVVIKSGVAEMYVRHGGKEYVKTLQ